MTSSFRYDCMSGHWTLVAASRRGLPIATIPVQGAVASDSRPCPFCPGNESELEPTRAVIADASGQWLARSVLNRYPMVSESAEPIHPRDIPDHREARAAGGVHEVIVEGREHSFDLSDFSIDQAERIMRMYRDRFRALGQRHETEAVILFRNRGHRSGSSQPHPHAQAVALDVLPSSHHRRHEIALEHHRETGRTLLDTVLASELKQAVRIVESDSEFVAFCPFSPHRSYETWIVPRIGLGPFARLADQHLVPLADMLTRTIRRVRRATSDAAYNLVLRSPPVREEASAAGYWYFEILPRTGGDAGFELATDLQIVPVPPELSAEDLSATSDAPLIDRKI